MSIRRIGRHLLHHHWQLKRIFTPAVLARIEQAIKDSERTHAGQLRFVVEGALDGRPLWRNQPPRERALDVFSLLRVWDTEHNNGVLIYLLFADHAVEIVADRGVHARVEQPVWRAICQEMESAFGTGHYEAGVINGIKAVTQHLTKHYPAGGGRNELPDRPVII